MDNHCLNCHQQLNSNFCHHCGQKASTHRFSLKNFMLQDLVRGVFDIDKGFIYTIKELFVRPGHSIREYIQGKRIKHFNYFTFIILIITLGHLGDTLDVKLIDTTHYFSTDKEFLAGFEKLSKDNPKLFILIRIPFFALFSFWFFRKSKQNLTEHLVLNTYKASGELLIAIIFTILSVFFKNTFASTYIFSGVVVVSLIYSIWFYYQYFSTFGYSRAGLYLRSILTSVILILVIVSVTEFMLGLKAGFEQHNSTIKTSPKQ